MPEPLSTEAQAAAAGLATPQNLDLLAQGDDAILRNARFTADALTAAAEARKAADAKAAADAALQLTDAVDPVFTITDSLDRRTWLEIAPDGGPTAHSAAKMVPAVAGPVGDGLGLSSHDTATSGLSYAVVDAQDRRTDIELDPAGHVTERVLGLWRSRLGLEAAATLDNRVVCSGDSMTGGAFGTPYPSHLKTLTGWDVVNLGVGGETSAEIAARLGGRPMLVSFPGGQIPADTSEVPVTLTTDTALELTGIGSTKMEPLKQQWNGLNPSFIAGVEGTLVRNTTTGAYTWKRTAAGTAVPVNYWTPLDTTSARLYRGSIHVLWWGHNDGAQVNGVEDHTDVIARERAMIATLAGSSPRYLVLGTSSRSGPERRPTYPQYLRAFGRRYLNIAEYLMSDAAFQDAGITKTAQDDTDIAAGWVPSSFRGDGIHLTDAGNLLVAKQVQRRIKEMGWL